MPHAGLMLLSLALVPLLSSAGNLETARDYYNELLSVRGLNPLARFVCFPELEPQTFFIMGRSSEFEMALKEKGRPMDPELHQRLEKGGELLYWEGFHKGVAGGPSLLEKGASASEWSMSFELPGTKQAGIITVHITWPTLRYRLRVGSKEKPALSESYGRCESIAIAMPDATGKGR